MGTPKALARCPAITDKKTTEDIKSMEIYTEYKKDAKKIDYGCQNVENLKRQALTI